MEFIYDTSKKSIPSQTKPDRVATLKLNKTSLNSSLQSYKLPKIQTHKMLK